MGSAQTSVNKTSAIFGASQDLIKDFELKEFATRQELFDFAEKKDLTNRICFGFSVEEHAPNDFELELFFNDQMKPSEGRAIPNQKLPSYDYTSKTGGVMNYAKYTS